LTESPKLLYCTGNRGQGTIVTLNFKLEVDIWQLYTCAMKIMQYNAH